MESAAFQANLADKTKTTDVGIENERSGGIKSHPGKTPGLTAKLLEMDEQQLDLLTGKRGAIFKNEPASRAD